MPKKVSVYIFFFLILLGVPLAYTHAESNSGFLSDTIWYSQSDFSDGDTIEIHIAVWNAEQSTLQAKVEFTDGAIILGVRSIVVPAHTLTDVSIPWSVTAGDHSIKARITDASLKTDTKVTAITLADTEQSLPKVFVPKKILGSTTNQTAEAQNVTRAFEDKVTSVLPGKIAQPIVQTVNEVDAFRLETSDSLKGMIENTNKKIESFNPKGQAPASATVKPETTAGQTAPAKSSALSGTEKPIAYVELFLLSVASFIFKNSIVFYILCGYILFIILRFIYRKVRR